VRISPCMHLLAAGSHLNRILNRFGASLAIAVVAACLFASSAYGAYAYNYGWDWSRPPFNDSNTLADAQTAANSQAIKGYVARAYSYSWASDVYNNLPYLSVLYLDGHATAGIFACYHPETRFWPKNPLDPDGPQYESNLSMITSDISVNSTTLWDIGEGTQVSNHYRKLSSASSPVRIAVFAGCNTGDVPLGGHSLPYSAVYQAGMSHAVAFADTTTGGNIGYAWAYRYWDVLRRGYYSSYALQLARDYVYLNHGTYGGWDSYTWYGSANTEL